MELQSRTLELCVGSRALGPLLFIFMKFFFSTVACKGKNPPALFTAAPPPPDYIILGSTIIGIPYVFFKE